MVGIAGMADMGCCRVDMAVMAVGMMLGVVAVGVWDGSIMASSVPAPPPTICCD